MIPYIVKWQSNGTMVKTLYCVDEVKGSNPIDPIRILINLSHKVPMGDFHVEFSHWSTFTNLSTCQIPIGPLKLYDLHVTFLVIRMVVPCMPYFKVSRSSSYIFYSRATCNCFSGDMCHLEFNFWPCLTLTLTGHNFYLRALFEETFTLLERYCRVIHNDIFFEMINFEHFLILLDLYECFGSCWTSVRIPYHSGSFLSIGILLDHQKS